jgi:PAS domain S-box-containing protein
MTEIGVPDSIEFSRYRQIFEQSPAFLALLEGSEHRIVFANPAYHKLVGFRDVVGRPVREGFNVGTAGRGRHKKRRVIKKPA